MFVVQKAQKLWENFGFVQSDEIWWENLCNLPIDKNSAQGARAPHAKIIPHFSFLVNRQFNQISFQNFVHFAY
jgi:hypothetical protein